MTQILTIDGAEIAAARRFPEIALRRRTAEHPMVLFAIGAVLALGSIALLAGNGPAFAAIEKPATGLAQPASPKGDRLRPASEADRLCAGQNWGNLSAACLVAISRESGRTDADKIRFVGETTNQTN